MDKAQQQSGGIYIHVPFCIRKCAYCDFYSCTRLQKIPEFVDALIDEMKLAQNFSLQADTLYFGGGTPSLLEPEQIERLIAEAADRFHAAPDAEITLEANPGTVSEKKLAGFRQAGVNRINIGVQSFLDPSLDFLSRIHTADDAVQSVANARSAGFDNIGLDLIYGLPGQTEQIWQADLETALSLCPQHLSCYMLTYEPGTPMEKNLRNGSFQPLPENIVGRLYDFTVRFLEDNGFEKYEISNFSISHQTRSRHNQKYWTHAPYIGLGPSAHSYSLTGSRRSWNVRSLDAYLRQMLEGQRPVAETENLDLSQLMIETLYLRLRCTEGISIRAFEKRFHVDFDQRFGSVVADCESGGFMEIDDNQCRLTRKGMRFADNIASRLIDVV